MRAKFEKDFLGKKMLFLAKGFCLPKKRSNLVKEWIFFGERHLLNKCQMESNRLAC
jgi:hypothetical protein